MRVCCLFEWVPICFTFFICPNRRCFGSIGSALPKIIRYRDRGTLASSYEYCPQYSMKMPVFLACPLAASAIAPHPLLIHNKFEIRTFFTMRYEDKWLCKSISLCSSSQAPTFNLVGRKKGCHSQAR